MSESFREMFQTTNKGVSGPRPPRLVEVVAQPAQEFSFPVPPPSEPTGSHAIWLQRQGNWFPGVSGKSLLTQAMEAQAGREQTAQIDPRSLPPRPTEGAQPQPPGGAQPPMPRVIEMAPPETPMSMGQALRFLAAVKGPSPQDLALAQALEHVNRTENRSQAYRATLSPDEQKKIDAEQKLGYLPQLLSVAGSGGGSLGAQLGLIR